MMKGRAGKTKGNGTYLKESSDPESRWQKDEGFQED